MKRVLIVHAHPEPRSFTSSMKGEATRVFEALGCEVRVSDLYAKQFNPVASAADFAGAEGRDYLVYAKEQRAAYAGGTLADDIKEEVESVLWADLVVLNFPIFWFSVPAIMKGWIDRVFLSGPFYGGLRFYDKGGLTGKRAWITTTLGGQPHMFGERAVHGQIELMLSHLIRGTLGYVGFTVLEPFFGYHVPYISEDDRIALLARFRNAVQQWERREVLEMPSLDNFDQRLYPLSSLQTS
ncbi:NAD(P)H-dependent oxidoreductase [Trinickia mobilis]|uniref:NAD(P)H-dependent oxidoreductase n=1 Tax=Trinickia mobilis TaxID=2816356 RepID=UPI001A8DC580|nr:NAD(P)H-dependent oxidoreductase [Trinickia mobilis]